MAKRIAAIRVIVFVLWVASGALSQSECPSDDLLQLGDSTSPEGKRQEMRAWRSLPDAPSTVQPPTQAEKSQTIVDQARSPFNTLARSAFNAGVMRETKLGYVSPGLQPSFTASYKEAFTQKQSSTFLAPRKWMTFAPDFGQVRHETIHGANGLESYGHHIPWAGSVILRISQQAKAHPHITRALQVVQPQPRF